MRQSEEGSLDQPCTEYIIALAEFSRTETGTLHTVILENCAITGRRGVLVEVLFDFDF